MSPVVDDAAQVVSERNHMVFTPLLASTTVGTLDPRSVTVHLTQINKALNEPQNQLYIATAKNVDPVSKTVKCISNDNLEFDIKYDKLAVCTGSQVRSNPLDVLVQSGTTLTVSPVCG